MCFEVVQWSLARVYIFKAVLETTQHTTYTQRDTMLTDISTYTECIDKDSKG